MVTRPRASVGRSGTVVYHAPNLRPHFVRSPEGSLVTASWEEFRTVARRAQSEVIVVRDLGSWSSWDGFVVHQRDAPSTPRVLFTAPEPDNLRKVFGIRVTEVEWLDANRPIDLEYHVQRLLSRGLLQRCAETISTTKGLTRDLRKALVRACEPGTAVRSVNGLARLANRDRRTISSAWTRCVGPSPAVRLKALLDLILLLRAIRLREAGHNWTRVAGELDTSVDVLRRKTRDRLGLSLGQLTTDVGQTMLKRLQAMVDGQPAQWPLYSEPGYSETGDSVQQG